jgi:sugar O-acyltransferase (sialic acid O-acetyltransferase NeuD family)
MEGDKKPDTYPPESGGMLMPESAIAMDGPHPMVIIGAGGLGLEALWVAARMSIEPNFPGWNVLGFVDDSATIQGGWVEGLPVMGSVGEFLERYKGQDLYFHCALGNNHQRKRLADLFEENGFKPATLIDPLSAISPRSEIGAGSFIAPRNYIGPGVRLGRHVLINVAASIGHHCVMEDFSQACPGVRISGHCIIDRLAFLGSNAVIQPGKRVGEGATVGACSFVVRDVKPNTLVVGVPARTMQQAPPAA